jgi:hypothetical protein
MTAGACTCPRWCRPRSGSPPAGSCWRRRRSSPACATGSTPTGGCRSTGLRARTWSPVSRFTGHARSRHASQTLRRGLLDRGSIHRHALLSSRLSLRTRETGVIIIWHISRSTPKSRSAALTETRLFTRGSLSRTDWDVLYPRCVLHTPTPSPRPLPRSVLLGRQGLAPTALHPCSPSPSIQSA